MNSNADMIEKMEWSISVPIFNNTVILKQLGIAIGIPLSLVALVIGLSSGKSLYTLYGLGLIAALLFLIWLFIIAVYRGRYEAEFVLDGKCILCRTQGKQAKKNEPLTHSRSYWVFYPASRLLPAQGCWRSSGRRFLLDGTASQG
jgi:hypothetical protein